MMEQGVLTRYRASAGSGKTFKLAGVYLDTLFIAPHNYRNILAVTFTNKAAAEMKERILNTLYLIASGKSSDYLDHLMESTGNSETWVRRRALLILNAILHDYSRFSVGTIDSFFQKVLRAFVKESGLNAGFNLVLDHSVILSEAVDEMLISVENNDKLLKWLIDYSQFEISQGNTWNLKSRIMELGEEIFKEEFRLLFNDGKIVSDKESLRDGLARLIAFERSFSADLSLLAEKVIKVLSDADVSRDELYGKKNSLMTFLDVAKSGVPDKLSATIIKAWKDEVYYSGTNVPPSIARALSSGLHKDIVDICSVYEANIKYYKSSRLVTGNLYNLGILTDISDKVRRILNDSNKFLLSDAGDLLRQIIERGQTPFIYEKVGARYTNFMIDEFQDTSLIQWKNFYPLIENSIAEGDSNLVVGDIKQAIYRWRNSDWRILDNLDSLFDPETFRSESLGMNWRSATRIIDFNNRLFSTLPGMIEQKLELEDGVVSRLYKDVSQGDPGRKGGGYVRMKQVSAVDGKHQKSVVLDELPLLIEEIQDNGYRAGDIGILVRKNTEGQEVINRLMEYSDGVDQERRKRYSYQVISQDSLILDNSPVIQFIIASLEYISDKTDKLAHASMVHYLALVRGDCRKGGRPDLLSPDPLGQEFKDYIGTIRYMPLFDIVDRLIDYFKLGQFEAGIPFLNTLQDLILELSSSDANDLQVFLDWWKNEGIKKSVASPDQADSIQLMTIHKSKGLQFKVVIIPFLSWSMGHGMIPFIWVYSDDKAFRELGAVPVRYKKEITETYFRKYYDKEKLNVAIDKLNLLYVALTRSEECIYGFIPVGQRRETSIGTLLMDSIRANNILPDQVDDLLFTSGEPQVKSGGSEAELQNDLIIPYNVTISEGRLSLRLKAAGYIEMGEEGLASVNYGLLMHDILSGVGSIKDIQPVVHKACNQGLINIEERDELIRRLSKKFENSEIASWFSEEYESWIERDIILPGGIVKRPDRVVHMPGRSVIIDFKFGKESNSHIRQVGEYVAIVKKMVDVDVEGVIWYVDTDRIIRTN